MEAQGKPEVLQMKREPNADDCGSSIDLGDVSPHIIGYFKMGNQYYVSGRFSGRAGFLPVYGNLLHHALELFIKGALLRSGDDRERKTHNIKKLWSDIKRRVEKPDLAEFDQCIRELQKFENIRYPVEQAKEIGFRWSKEDRNKGKQPWGEMPRYEVSMTQIDELVSAIYDASGIPLTLIGAQMFPGLAKEHYQYRNDSLPATDECGLPSEQTVE